MVGLIAVLSACQASWHVLRGGPVLLSAAVPANRVSIYGLLAQTSVALLAVALTVLAILTALPERPGTRALRESGGLPDLTMGLLLTAGVCLALLMTSHLGAAIDHDQDGKDVLAYLTVSLAATAAVGFMFFGVAFGLALRRTDDPEDPSRGRGKG